MHKCLQMLDEQMDNSTEENAGWNTDEFQLNSYNWIWKKKQLYESAEATDAYDDTEPMFLSKQCGRKTRQNWPQMSGQILFIHRRLPAKRCKRIRLQISTIAKRKYVVWIKSMESINKHAHTNGALGKHMLSLLHSHSHDSHASEPWLSCPLKQLLSIQFFGF